MSSIASSGPVKFSDLQNVFGGNIPISFSEYYTDSNSGYTTGIPDLVSRGNRLNIRNFYNKSKIIPNLANFYFDPSNQNSYPGTGNTINNIGSSLSISSGTLNNISLNSSIANGVFEFNGSNSYVEYPQYNFNDTLTISVWINPSMPTTSSTMTILTNGYVNLNDTEPNLKGFSLFLNINEFGQGTINFAGGNNNSETNLIQSSQFNPIFVNNWQMITTSIDFTNLTVNVYNNNNQLGTSGSIPSNILRNTDNWSIGALRLITPELTSIYSGDTLNGKIASVKIWEKILTSTEITDEFNYTKSRFGIV